MNTNKWLSIRYPGYVSKQELADAYEASLPATAERMAERAIEKGLMSRGERMRMLDMRMYKRTCGYDKRRGKAQRNYLRKPLLKFKLDCRDKAIAKRSVACELSAATITSELESLHTSRFSDLMFNCVWTETPLDLAFASVNLGNVIKEGK